MTQEISPRNRLHGTRQILQFNWPMYATAAPALVLGNQLLQAKRCPRILKWGIKAGMALSSFWMLASVVVSWWVYDASPLMKWRWLQKYLPNGAGTWANFHAGLDESTPALRELFGVEGRALDFYDARTMTEPSIRRARALSFPAISPEAVDFRALPIETASLDTAFVFFAAHELRDPHDREDFFIELSRVLKLGGQLVLLEHVQDRANFAAFGPGAFHFWEAAEWRRLALPHFVTDVETNLTPFVRLWVWRKTI